MLGCN
jgi:hypothetical protein